MTLAYRTGSFVSTGNASLATPRTLTKPTGTADGDYVAIVTYIESDTNTCTITGFSSITIANTGAFKLQLHYKRASAEPASYSIAYTGTAWFIATGVAYSGGTGTGTLVDISGGSQADNVGSTGMTAPSITTTIINDMVAAAWGTFTGDNGSNANGFCTNYRGSLGGCQIADAVKATAAATGTSWPGPAGSFGNNEVYAALHVAFISDTGGAAAKSRVPYRMPNRVWSRRIR